MTYRPLGRDDAWLRWDRVITQPVLRWAAMLIQAPQLGVYVHSRDRGRFVLEPV